MSQDKHQIWLEWAKELQFIAQAGLTYTKDPFDKERFERIRELSAEMMSLQSGLPLEQVKGLFCNETGFQTPKLDTRAANVMQTIRSNTIKEVKEEAGLDVEAIRIIALHDRNLHNPPPYAYNVCKVFVLCEAKGGTFQANTETTESRYFSPDELPLLAEEKNTAEQIKMCFAAYANPNRQTEFD